ncbi:MAG: polysaccharide deacetylase family protein [Psychroflexus halocasei]
MKSSVFLKLLFPKRHWKIKPHHQKIYLTFDDGPIPEVTPWVLSLLKKYNAKATFFCIGENIEKHPDVFKQIIADGHAIGNHTFNHLNGWKTSTNDYLNNIVKTKNIIESHGVKTKLFRPPYGRCTNNQAQTLLKQGKEIIMWDVLTRDYDQNISKEKCFEIYQKNHEAGSIIVLHDSLKAYQNLKYLLPRILESKPAHLNFDKINL